MPTRKDFWNDPKYWELSAEQRERYFRQYVSSDPQFAQLTPEQQQRFYQKYVTGGTKIAPESPTADWRAIATLAGMPSIREAIAPALGRAPEFVQEGMKGIARAMPGAVASPLRTVATAADSPLLAVASNLTGLRPYREEMHDVARKIEGMGNAVPDPRAASLGEVNSTGDFVNWLANMAGSSAPQMAGTAAASVVNPGLGVLASGTMMTGQQAAETEERTGESGGALTLTAGALMGVLEQLPIGRALSRAIPKSAQAGLLKHLLPRLKNAGVTSAQEAVTEFGQTVIGKLASNWIAENEIKITGEDLREAAESAVAGGIMGVGFGGVAGVGPNPTIDETPIGPGQKPAGEPIVGVPNQWRRASKRYANAPLWMSNEMADVGVGERNPAREAIARRWATEAITDLEAVAAIKEIDPALDVKQAFADLKKFRETEFFTEPAAEEETEAVRSWREEGEPELMAEGYAPPIEGVAELVEIGRMADDKPESPAGWFHQMLRKYGRSRGAGPGAISLLRNMEEAGMAGNAKEAGLAVRGLKRGMKEAFGVKTWTKLPGQARAMLNSVMRGERPASDLPEPLQAPVTRMRQAIDNLARKAMRSGAVTGELKAVLGKNLGVYLARSYRIFDDPKWATTVKAKHPELVNSVKQWLTDEFPDMTDGQKKVMIERLLHRPDRDSNPLAVLEQWSRDKSGVGGKFLAALKKRKNVPVEIRKLWGEYDDPGTQFLRSIEKLSQLVETQKYQLALRQTGLEAGWLTEEALPEPSVWGIQSEDLVGTDSPRYEALEGLRTTPEIKQAIEDSLDISQPTSMLFRAYLKVNSAVKLGKTAGSPSTQARNFFAGPIMMMAAGHWDMRHMRSALTTLKTEFGGGPGSKSLSKKMSDVGLWDKGWTTEDYLVDAVRRGVTDESAMAGEVGDTVKDLLGNEDVLGGAPGQVLKRAMLKPVKLAMKTYTGTDNLYKLFAYADEFAKYREIYSETEKSHEEIRRIAAQHVRDTYPTYSLVPKGIKALRRIPFVGSFTSFPAEMVRTQYNILKLIADELKDPRTAHLGKKRAAGLIAAQVAVPAASAVSLLASGLLKKDEDDLREFLPQWTRNSNLIHVDHDDKGNYRFVDLSYTDPYEYTKKPLIALLNGEDWYGSLTEAVRESLDPFLSEEILAKAIREAFSNKKTDGGPVVNPSSGDLDMLIGKVAHVMKAAQPGITAQMGRVAESLSDDPVTETGIVRETKPEIFNMALGMRRQTINLPTQLTFNMSQLARDMSSAEYIFTRVANQKNTSVTVEEMESAYEKSDEARRKIFERMHKLASAAMRLGLSRERVYEILNANQLLSPKKVSAILDGIYMKYAPSNRFLGSLEKRLAALGGEFGGVTPEEIKRRREIADWLARR